MKRQIHCASSLRSDAGDSPQLLDRCCGDVSDRPKTRKQSASGNKRDSGNGREEQLRGSVGATTLSTAAHTWLPSASRLLLHAYGQAVEPKRRVVSVDCAQNDNPLLRRGQESTTYGCRSQRASVKVRSFNEKVRRAACSPEVPKLCPQTRLDNREVQVDHELSLNQAVFGHLIVPYGASLHAHVSAETRERIGHAARTFVNVRDDTNICHAPTLPRDPQRKRVSFLAKARKL